MNKIGFQRFRVAFFGLLALLGISTAGIVLFTQLSPSPTPLPSPSPQGQGSMLDDDTFVTEEYSGQKCAFRIYEPSPDSFIAPLPDIQKQIFCSFRIHENLRPYTFRIVGVKGQNNIERIDVYAEGQPELIQTFSGFTTYPLAERVFEAQDINFDGYLDIGTLAWYGTGGFAGFQHWIFNPSERNFILDEQFVTLTNPQVVAEKKQILADNPIDGRVLYEWRDGVLIKIGSVNPTGTQ